MKKLLVFLFVVVATLSVNAQDIYMGGTFNLWRNTDANRTNFTIAPEVGYNLSEKWAVGVTISYAHDYLKGLKTTSVAIAPYARFSYYENKIVRLFVDGGLGFSTSRVKDADDAINGYEIGLQPGIALKLNKSFSLVAKCGFVGFRDDYTVKEDGFGISLRSEDLSFGFHYEF